MEWLPLVGGGFVMIAVILTGVSFLLSSQERRLERSADKRDASLNNRINDTFGSLDRRLVLVENGLVGLRTEIGGLRTDIHAMDKRLVVLETQQSPE